jgi:ABC-type sugar transport system ATPase subunit
MPSPTPSPTPNPNPAGPNRASPSPHPGPPHPAALELRGAAFAFGSGPALAGLGGLDLQVAAGERLLLIGPSGVGKTTLLKGIAGLTPTHRGSIEINGRNVTLLPPEARGAVYLHQSPVLFPHLSVEGNVAFPLQIRGVPEAEVRTRVREALDAVRLGSVAARGAAELSGGERHRVALARAVVARPPVLLLDEPLASLDPALREEVRDAILALQTRYAPALILVTHDLADVGHLAHRVGVLLDGTLAQVTTPDALFRDPASLAVARFLGMGPELAVTRSGDAWYHADFGMLAPAGAGAGAGATAILPPAARAFLPAPPSVGAAVPPPVPAPWPMAPEERDSQARQGHTTRSILATLEEIRYPGPGPTATLRVGAGGTRIAVPLQGPGAPQVGDTVLLVWDPAQVRVFPQT